LLTSYECLNTQNRLRLAGKAGRTELSKQSYGPLIDFVRVYSIPEVFFSLFLGIESQIEARTLSIKGIEEAWLWKSSLRSY